MSLYFDPESGGFFDDAIHSTLPANAVPITAEEHRLLLKSQSEGGWIRAGEDGRPQIDWPFVSVDGQRARAIGAVKREASRRITSVAPLWRQSNDNALLALAAIELESGATAHDFMPAIERRKRIDAIRAASDTLEAAIVTMTEEELATLDVAAPDYWPEESQQ